MVERIERCRMVDIAQEGLAEQPGWLKALGRERDLCLGVYADVDDASAPSPSVTLSRSPHMKDSPA